MDEQTLLLVMTAIIALGTLALVWFAWRSKRSEVSVQPSMVAGAAPVTTDSHSAANQSRKDHPTPPRQVYDGLIQVTATGHEAIPIALEAGDVVSGVVKESDGYPFDAFVYDQRGYHRFLNGHLPRRCWKVRDVSVASVRFAVEARGVYYFVLDLCGKQRDRTVTLRLIASAE